MDSSALGVSAETKDEALTEHEYIQKKTEDRRFRGNQSLAHGHIFFEIYVFRSVRVELFFTHSREASSLFGRSYYAALASVRPLFIMKLWDIPCVFICGCDGKGGNPKEPDTLLKVTLKSKPYLKKFKS